MQDERFFTARAVCLSLFPPLKITKTDVPTVRQNVARPYQAFNPLLSHIDLSVMNKSVHSDSHKILFSFLLLYCYNNLSYLSQIIKILDINKNQYDVNVSSIRNIYTITHS